MSTAFVTWVDYREVKLVDWLMKCLNLLEIVWYFELRLLWIYWGENGKNNNDICALLLFTKLFQLSQFNYRTCQCLILRQETKDTVKATCGNLVNLKAYFGPRPIFWSLLTLKRAKFVESCRINFLSVQTYCLLVNFEFHPYIKWPLLC